MSDVTQVGEARRFAASFCAHLGFNEIRKGRVSIIINELGNNLVRYAQGGKLIFRSIGTTGLEILSIDRGPGLDTSKVMHDGYTTGDTPGTGLGAVRRQSDRFDIFSIADKCTVVMSIIFASDTLADVDDKFDVGAVSVPIDGEYVSGDGWEFLPNGDAAELLVVDGLGHGILAQKAANEAIEGFTKATSRSPDQLMQVIHSRLKSTRGGAVFLVSVNQTQVVFTGVGNVRAIIQTIEKTKPLISQNGTAGVQIRSARVMSEPWPNPSYIILHSDGIASSWDFRTLPGILSRHPAVVCAAVFEFFNRGSDDSTVVAFRRRV